jgi:hypothetical protein
MACAISRPGKTHASMHTGERRTPDLYGSMPKTRQLMFPGNGENPVSALAHVRSHIRSSHDVHVTCVNTEEGHKRAAHALARNCQCWHCWHYWPLNCQSSGRHL